MILKAGTYRFNDVLVDFPTTTNVAYYGFKGVLEGVELTYGIATYDNFGNVFDGFVYGVGDPTLMPNVIEPLYAIGTFNGVELNGWQDDVFKTSTLETDIEVDDTYGTWYIANTNYNEVNAKPLAEITYNGETIAQLNAGETATLPCAGKKMASDVVVKVNEVESEIPEGYIKPEGTLELVFNNIEAEFPIDCSQYAKVTVNTAEPLKISDPTVLDNITDSPWGVGGSVFLYEGATTDSYEKDALYYLEDTEK